MTNIASIPCRYGFRRITQGPDAGAYYHEMFLRGRIGLCQRMTRQKVKGTGHKQPADASSEPNFYEMPPLDPSGVTDSVANLSDGLTVIPPMKLSTEQLLQADAPILREIPNRPSHGFVLDGRNEASPGMRSVHGAAHLLQGIASGRSFALPAASTGALTDASCHLPQSSGELLANSFMPDLTPRNQEEV